MHRFLVPAERWRGDSIEFSQEQAHQLKRVLRLGRGDNVRVFDGERPCDAVVELLSSSEARIVGEAPQAAEPRTTLLVYPALLPRDRFETVLQKLTEVGASAIVPIITQRSLVRAAPDEQRLARWRVILIEATEQAGRGRVPELGPVQPFSSAMLEAPGPRLLAYAAEPGFSLAEALPEAPMATVSLFVGPEGDFEPAEVDLARQAGARIVTLGPRILRAETASPIFAALVLYELERRTGGP
jgi:16S rRNA (uracil1498-N3)-methyltransferase